MFLLSRPYYLLVHTLIEFLCVVITTAVFLIAWNTRATVRSPFFVILAAGFLVTGLVDLLHTFTYQGMQVLPAANANTATQLWLVARALGACAFLTAVLVLNRPVRISARAWLLFFLSLGGALVALIWPLGLFPVSYIEGVGLSPFKVQSEYVVMVLLLLAALLLVMRRRHLDQRLVTLLLGALVMNILSELLFTWYVDVYGVFNFLGHYCKLGGVVLVYFALIEGTLRAPFGTLFREMTDSYDQLNTELQKRRLAEQQQQRASRDAGDGGIGSA
ncbi:MAG: MASE3 domain-containing protein [Desulfuromonadales bacterium]